MDYSKVWKDMDYSKVWKEVCDGIWICTTTKYINDPKRVPAMLNQLKLLHIPSDMIHLNIMPHGSHSNGHLSCTANHIEVMKKARSKNHRRILVFEDDLKVYQTADIGACLKVLKEFVQTKRFDILYLGCVANNIERGISNKYQIRRASCYGTHAYLISTDLMEIMKTLSPQDVVDHAEFLLANKQGTKPFHSFPSIDIWFILLSDAKYVDVYSMSPTIFYQQSLPLNGAYKYTIEPFISTAGGLHQGIILMSVFLIFVIVVIAWIAVHANKSRK